VEPFRFVYGTLGFRETHTGNRWFNAVAGVSVLFL